MNLAPIDFELCEFVFRFTDLHQIKLSHEGIRRPLESRGKGRFGGGVRADDLPCPGNGLLFMSFRFGP